MIDPELKQQLHAIEYELRHIRKGIGGTGAALWKGIVYGAGYVIGAALIVVIIGWILNIIGVIPAFQNQVGEFKMVLESMKPVK